LIVITSEEKKRAKCLFHFHTIESVYC